MPQEYTKYQKAKAIKGFRFIHVLSPCPPGWKYDADDTVKLSRLAVQMGLFALYEVEDGRFKRAPNCSPRRNTYRTWSAHLVRRMLDRAGVQPPARLPVFHSDTQWASRIFEENSEFLFMMGCGNVRPKRPDRRL